MWLTVRRADCDSDNLKPPFRGADKSAASLPLLVGVVGCALAIQHIASDGRAFAMILGQSTMARPGSQSLLAQDARDPAQSAGFAFGQRVLPVPASTGSKGATEVIGPGLGLVLVSACRVMDVSCVPAVCCAYRPTIRIRPLLFSRRFNGARDRLCRLGRNCRATRHRILASLPCHSGHRRNSDDEAATGSSAPK